MYEYIEKESNLEDFLRIAKEEGVEIPAPFMDLLKEETRTYENEERYTGGFFHAPASTRFHGAYEGGLYDHSKQVYLRLKELTVRNSLVWTRKESPFIIGYYHDLCKVDSYFRNQQLLPEVKYAYNDLAEDKAHAEKSLRTIQKYMELTEEEYYCILFHMGPYASKNATWEEITKLYSGYDEAIRKYQNVMWTHMADMLASKVDGM